MKKFLLGLAALAAAGGANASIIPTLSNNPTDIGGGLFEYTYTATLASDQALFSGSYFTLYDIVGFAGFGTVPSNWTPSSQLLGLTPDNVLPDDDAAITNVSFTYSGPTVNYSETESENIERELGNFVIRSTVGVFGFEDFTSEAVRNSGQSRGSLVATIGDDSVAVPGGGDGNPVGAIPEPETWAMMIVGFGMVGATARRRKQTSVTA